MAEPCTIVQSGIWVIDLGETSFSKFPYSTAVWFTMRTAHRCINLTSAVAGVLPFRRRKYIICGAHIIISPSSHALYWSSNDFESFSASLMSPLSILWDIPSAKCHLCFWLTSRHGDLSCHHCVVTVIGIFFCPQCPCYPHLCFSALSTVSVIILIRIMIAANGFYTLYTVITLLLHLCHCCLYSSHLCHKHMCISIRLLTHLCVSLKSCSAVMFIAIQSVNILKSPFLFAKYVNVTNVGRGGSVVGSVPCVWRVAGSDPTLAATYWPWAIPSLAVACSVSAC